MERDVYRNCYGNLKQERENNIIYNIDDITHVIAALDDDVFLIKRSGPAASSVTYNTVNSWCFDNCENKWLFSDGTLLANIIYSYDTDFYYKNISGRNFLMLKFTSKKDALMFKLRWCK